MEAPNIQVGKICSFNEMTRYVSKAIQDRQHSFYERWSRMHFIEWWHCW